MKEGKARPAEQVFPKDPDRRPVCDEVFAGSGHLARALEAKGFMAVKWDIILSPAHDFTSPAAVGRLMKQLRDRHAAGRLFLYVHVGVPYTSFSAAFFFWPGRLRNRQFPWGIPGQKQKRQGKIDVANTIVRNALRMIRWLLDHDVIVSIENPSTLSFWMFQKLLFGTTSAVSSQSPWIIESLLSLGGNGHV